MLNILSGVQSIQRNHFELKTLGDILHTVYSPFPRRSASVQGLQNDTILQTGRTGRIMTIFFIDMDDKNINGPS